MQRLILLLLCIFGVLGVVYFFIILFSVPSPTDGDGSREESSFESSAKGMHSSLNLIVRVSPRLGGEKKELSSASAASAEPAPRNDTLYQPYEPDITFGEQGSILFFAQADDPFSLAHEEIILSYAVKKELRLPFFRVDFLSKQMTLAYGVIVPDTFIVLDAAGQRLRSIIHPSTVELRTLLTSSSFQ